MSHYKFLPLFFIVFFVGSLLSGSQIKENQEADIIDKILKKSLSGENLCDIDELQMMLNVLPQKKQIFVLSELTEYYLGEACTEIFDECMTQIGNEIVPELVSRKQKAINVRKEFKRLAVKNKEERDRKINKVLDAIKNKVILFSEYPPNINDDLKNRKEVIGVFLNDFRLKNQRFPKNLLILREFVFNNYGYNLAIVDPYGNPFEYSFNETTFSLSEKKVDK